MPELLRLDSVNQYADASGRSISLAATDVYEATYVFAFPTFVAHPQILRTDGLSSEIH